LKKRGESGKGIKGWGGGGGYSHVSGLCTGEKKTGGAKGVNLTKGGKTEDGRSC